MPNTDLSRRQASFTDASYDNTQSIVVQISDIVSGREISGYDLKVLGDLLLALSRGISIKVDEEILNPISKWINDDKWKNILHEGDNLQYNWVMYKRQQRRWTKQQKRLAAQRLKLYRKELTEKRLFRKGLRQHIRAPNRKKEAELVFDDEFMEEIVSPFSDSEHCRREVRRQFFRAASVSFSDLLPWKVLVRCDVVRLGQVPFGDLGSYFSENRKLEIVSKFIHLLELERSGDVEIVQEEPFGGILVRLEDVDIETDIFVTDQDGCGYKIDWAGLNSKQRARLLADIKQHRVLCKEGDGK